MVLENDCDMRCTYFKVDAARVSLEYRSVMITTNWFPFVVFGNGPSMSTAIDSTQLLAGKRFKGFVCLSFAFLPAHLQQWVTVVHTPLVMRA